MLYNPRPSWQIPFVFPAYLIYYPIKRKVFYCVARLRGIEQKRQKAIQKNLEFLTNRNYQKLKE